MIETKVCTKCRDELPRSDFYRAKQKKDGLKSWCRFCSIKDTKKWQGENPEKTNTYKKNYRANNPEKRRESCANWYAKNPTHKTEWRHKNPFTYREHNKRSKLNRKKRTGFAVVSYDIILERDGFRCHICGGEVDPTQLHFDHIVPLARGGAHSEENISVSHATCNLRKGTKLIGEHLAVI